LEEILLLHQLTTKAVLAKLVCTAVMVASTVWAGMLLCPEELGGKVLVMLMYPPPRLLDPPLPVVCESLPEIAVLDHLAVLTSRQEIRSLVLLVKLELQLEMRERKAGEIFDWMEAH